MKLKICYLWSTTLHTGDDLKQKTSQKGVALVITLGAVVMVTIVVMAFFSRAFLNRQISDFSTNLIKADQVARSALDIVVGEVREEIRLGSTPAQISGTGMTIYTPTSNTKMVPVRDAAGASEANVIRTSSSSPLAGSGATAVVSTAKSSTPSVNNRYISANTWNKIQLCSTPVTAANAPNWIMLTRSGPNTDPALTVAKASDATDTSHYVVGRYAYTIYDEGGLLNINVAGAPSTLSASDIGKKGSVAMADLTALGLSTTQSDALVNWRNAASKGNYVNSIFGTGGAADSGFTQILAGDNTFLNRQELLKYATTNGLDTTAATTPLKYLATATYESNSPSVKAGTDSTLNPDFKMLISSTTGKPLQRFPLSRFRLLDQDPSKLSAQDKSDIQKYFGLTPTTDATNTYRAWMYHDSVIGSVAAAISAGRDPDLFELVKAAINNGSLGVNLADSTNDPGIVQIRDTGGGSNYTLETNTSHQVARIIANMIDQYDSDNYPTTICLGGADPTKDPFVYGIENLPYFSRVMVKAYFPSGKFTDITGSTLFYAFELWNPHQGAVVGSLPSNVRIVVNPDAQYSGNYTNNIAPINDGVNRRGIWGGPYPQSDRKFPAKYTAEGGGIDVGNLSAYNNPAIVSGSMILDPPSVPAPSLFDTLSLAGGAWIWMDTTDIVFSLQFKDALGNWHTYSSFAGMDNNKGSTGMQSIVQYTYRSDLDPNGSDLYRYGGVWYKSDPRTFRYRMGNDSIFRPVSGLGGVDDTKEQTYNEHMPAFFKVGAYPILLYKNDTIHAKDYDGTARVGDGYVGATNTTNPISQSEARPIMLNRPFRSVGELGYVFRDTPWKSLNFFSSDSGDAGLLDLFSLEDGAVVAGKTNLNTAQPKVLQALIQGSIWSEQRTTQITNASTLATDISNITNVKGASPYPLSDIGALLAKAATYSTSAAPAVDANYPAFKTEKEASIRALSAGTQTRTWNLLIDLVAQTGRYPQGAAGWDKFVVKGESHYWLHVAVDRYTGKILKSQLETVNE